MPPGWRPGSASPALPGPPRRAPQSPLSALATPLQAKQTKKPLWALVWDNGAGRTPGMKPSWPDTKTRLPVFIACEYGPTAPGALSVLTTCRPAQQRYTTPE